MIKFLFGIFLFANTLASFADTDLKFVEELTSDGEYFRALTILKENEFMHRKQARGAIFQKKILELHLMTQEFENFDVQVQNLLERYSNFLSTFDPNRIDAEVKLHLKNYKVAYHALKKTNAPLEEKYLFRAYAEESADDLPTCDSEDCKTIIRIEEDIIVKSKTKNEYLALALGVVPGMGQVYAGHTSSGIATFILNGLMIVTSVAAFNNDEEVLGWASAVVGSTFYLSSIYAGVETARRHNLAQVEQAKKRLKDVSIQFQLYRLIFE